MFRIGVPFFLVNQIVGVVNCSRPFGRPQSRFG